MVIRVGLSEVTERERGELGLRVVLPGRKFHSHPALRPGRLIELQRIELRHHTASHAQDDSKKLKYDQIVEIGDAVVTAHQLSAAMLRRNMEMHENPPRQFQQNTCAASSIRSTVPAKSCVPNNSTALPWMTLTASCKSLRTAT